MKITNSLKAEFTSFLPADIQSNESKVSKLVSDFSSALGRLPESDDISGRVTGNGKAGIQGKVKASAGESLKIKELPAIIGWFLAKREEKAQAKYAASCWEAITA